MTEISDEDRERIKLLQLVTNSRNEFKKLSLDQLKRLQELIEKKDYSHDKKAHKSKVKLLGKINVRIYELTELNSYDSLELELSPAFQFIVSNDILRKQYCYKFLQ